MGLRAAYLHVISGVMTLTTCRLLIVDTTHPHNTAYIDCLQALESWALYSGPFERYEFCLVDEYGLVHIEHVNRDDKKHLFDSLAFAWAVTIEAMTEKENARIN